MNLANTSESTCCKWIESCCCHCDLSVRVLFYMSYQTLNIRDTRMFIQYSISSSIFSILWNCVGQINCVLIKKKYFYFNFLYFNFSLVQYLKKEKCPRNLLVLYNHPYRNWVADELAVIKNTSFMSFLFDAFYIFVIAEKFSS